jgi:hypothetical protein
VVLPSTGQGGDDGSGGMTTLLTLVGVAGALLLTGAYAARGSRSTNRS